MDDTQIFTLFGALWSDIPDSDAFEKRKPLLAHYTSIQVLERIITSNEIWFSNPMLMNDMEELRFGINEGDRLFHDHTVLREACGSEKRYLELYAAFDVYYYKLDFEHALDIYAFCLSEHDIGETDGILSMWRGYGGKRKRSCNRA